MHAKFIFLITVVIGSCLITGCEMRSPLSKKETKNNCLHPAQSSSLVNANTSCGQIRLICNKFYKTIDQDFKNEKKCLDECAKQRKDMYPRNITNDCFGVLQNAHWQCKRYCTSNYNSLWNEDSPYRKKNQK